MSLFVGICIYVRYISIAIKFAHILAYYCIYEMLYFNHYIIYKIYNKFYKI